MANYSVFSFFDEVENLLDFIAHRNLFGNLNYCIFQTEVTRINDAVSVGDMAQNALAGVHMLKHYGVHAVVSCGISAEHNIRRNVFLYAASALYERIATYANVLLNDYAVALDRAVVNLTFSGKANTNADNATVVDVHIVADMNTVHNKVLVSNDGRLVGIGTSGNNHVFADVVVVTDGNLCGSTFHVVKILRCGTYYGILVNGITAAHCHAVEYTCMSLDDAVVTNGYVAFDVGKRSYFYMISSAS